MHLNSDEIAQQLYTLATMRIPFGKYKGRLLVDIPTAYYQWMSRQGFPDSELGRAMEMVWQMKMDGSAQVLRGISTQHGAR